MANELVIGLILSFIQILGAIVLSIGAVFSGLKILDRMTVGIEEWKEIKKGNTAVGILYAVVALCIMLMILPRIEDVLKSTTMSLPWEATLAMILISLFNYLAALALSIFILFISLNLLDKIMVDMDEMGSMKKGNIAIALLVSMVLLAVAFAIRYPMDYMFLVLKAIESLLTGFPF